MDFLNRIFLYNRPTPKDVAKDRLKLILIHDRGELSAEILEKIKMEIIEVLAKYIEIEYEEVDLTVTSPGAMEGESPALIANIPIKHVKGR